MQDQVYGYGTEKRLQHFGHTEAEQTLQVPKGELHRILQMIPNESKGQLTNVFNFWQNLLESMLSIIFLPMKYVHCLVGYVVNDVTPL